jgi:cytochrome c-type biogenesis protein CcmH/NrfG
MTRRNAQPPAGVSRQTLMTAVVIALMVGFFSGLVFGVYKSAPPTGSLPGGGAPQSAADTQRMLATLEERTRTDPKDVEAWIQMGHLYFDSDQAEKAIEAYETALRLQPNNAPVLTDLGIMYRRSGKPEEAIQRFDLAIAADPKLEMPRFNKGIVLMHDLKNEAEAIAAWEALLAINPLAMAPNGQSVDELVTHYREHARQGSD